MQAVILAVICAAAAVAANLGVLKDRVKKPGKGEIIMLVSAAVSCAGCIIFHYIGFGFAAAGAAFFYFFMFNYYYGNAERELVTAEFFFILALLSAAIAPATVLKPVYLPVSFLAVVFIGPAFYKFVARRSANISTVFFTLFLHVLLVYEFFFSELPHAAASLSCAALAAVFYNFDRDKDVSYYLEGKRLDDFLLAGLPAFFVQCFILVFIIKNPIF
jgi:hypothetical protein